MTGSNELLALALEAARAAGAIAMRAFRTDQHVEYKSEGQPVTAADRAADASVRRILLDATPDYGWLSEESVDDPARLHKRRVWIVDPIDGTASFVAGRPEFTISIGLVEDHLPVIGVIFNPATDECFHAVRNGGAWHEQKRLQVRPPDRGRILAASRNEIREGDFVRFPEYELLPVGSTAYKMTRVAAGLADAFVSRGPKGEWDVCAGDLIVTEAGGVVSDIEGSPLRYNRPNPSVNGTIAAASTILHDLLVERSRT